MGKDSELPDHFGGLHAANLTPHRAIWTLAVISAVIGIIGITVYFGDGSAPSDATIKALPANFWSNFGYTTHDKMAALPNTFLLVTLASNFGTFLLYALSCFVCMVAFNKHPSYNFIKHTAIPVFGLAANLICMAFYLIGPFIGIGTKMEPLLALGVAACWAVYGGIYFIRSSKATGRTTMISRAGRTAKV
jgi:amino acid transporter